MAGARSEAIRGQTNAGTVTKAEELARQVVRQCLERGVAEFVLCPGSRNSPLLAAALLTSAKCWSHMDERAAAFFALGRCRALGRPVAVVTTSGTAAFEAFPAMIEALYQRLPLLAITADRPKRYRGTGAPQAIEQAGMFCVYAVSNQDSEDGKLNLDTWDGWGPAHVNVCLEEPLFDGLPDPEPLAVRAPALPTAMGDCFPPGRRRKLPAPDVVLVGSLRPEERAPVRSFLQQLQCPIFAEAISGLREDKNLATWLLRDGEHSLNGDGMASVLRIGGVPSARFWRDLDRQPKVRVSSILAHGFSGIARDSQMFDSLEQVEFEGRPATIDLAASRRRSDCLEELLREFPESEPALVRALSREMPAGGSVFLGNSLPLREWNLAAAHESRAADWWANRGANGIDGNVSTWLGWSGGSERATWGVFGDVTALYDLNSLWVSGQLTRAQRLLVVINNGGGGIFRRLPGLAATSGELGRILRSEHRIGFDSWAAMWGCAYHRWDGGSLDLLPAEGMAILEVRPDAAATESFWAAWNRVRTEES